MLGTLPTTNTVLEKAYLEDEFPFLSSLGQVILLADEGSEDEFSDFLHVQNHWLRQKDLRLRCCFQTTTGFLFFCFCFSSHSLSVLGILHIHQSYWICLEILIEIGQVVTNSMHTNWYFDHDDHNHNHNPHDHIIISIRVLIMAYHDHTQYHQQHHHSCLAHI